MNVCSLSHVLNVYDAVILTVIAGFHSVQHKTAPSGWWAGDSQTKPTNLGRVSPTTVNFNVGYLHTLTSS